MAVGGAGLRAVALAGFLAALGGGTAVCYRGLPVVYPRERTRLDPRSYRVVRGALATGAVVGAVGAVTSLVDTVGTVRALGGRRTGLLAGAAILLPDSLGPAMVRVGVALLVGGALLAAVVEVRAAPD
jgi:hypothetical protein